VYAALQPTVTSYGHHCSQLEPPLGPPLRPAAASCGHHCSQLWSSLQPAVVTTAAKLAAVQHAFFGQIQNHPLVSADQQGHG